MSTVLDFALQCRAMGITTFPVRADTKIPAVAWGKLTGPVDECQLRTWFDMADDHFGIAIKCGSASRDLVVRDFDDPADMAEWNASNTRMLERFPRARSRSGMQHVYFTAAGVGVVPLKNAAGDKIGEIRGNGGIIVAPPTRGYVWQRPLSGEIPLCDPSAFMSSTAEQKQPAFGAEITQTLAQRWSRELKGPPEESFPPDTRTNVIVEHLAVLGIDESLDEIVKRFVPTRFRSRDESLFRLTQRLRGLFPKFDPVVLGPIVRHWFNLSRRWIRPAPESQHTTLEANWSDFVRKWNLVQSAAGGSIKRAMSLAEAMPTPDCAKGLSDSLQRLARLCYVLHKHHQGESWPLSGELAGECVGGSQEWGAKCLRRLKQRGIIDQVTFTYTIGLKAYTYRWVGGE